MRRMAKFALAFALAVGAGSASAQDAGAPIAMGRLYKQSPEVQARYPDLPIELNTPALQPGRTTLTTQSELEAFLHQLAKPDAPKPDAPVVVETLVKTPQGRAVPILYFTRERLTDPAQIRATGRPIIWLIGQQHGNEPAGGEAMLAIAKALADGDLRAVLDNIVVVMVPRANPDGAAAEVRDTSARMDLNRDHATLALVETRGLHAAVQKLPPDLVIDAHEFSVAQRWLEKFGALQAVDLMLLDATHPMVPEPSRQLARSLFLPAIEVAVTKYGLAAFPYHTTSTNRADRTIALGGNAPGIARNAFGLSGAVSFLLETRGVGIGMEGYQRRVATHYIAIRAALEAAATAPEQLRSTVLASRREISQRRGTIIVRHSVENDAVTLPLIDPFTAVTRSVETLMSNSNRITVTAHRSWPAGYVLLPEARGGAAELRLLGASLCTVTSLVEIDAEMFEIHDRGSADRRAINPDAAVKAMVRAVRVAIPAGSVYVPTAQPAGRRISLALEPDAPGSFVAVDVVRTPPDETTVPIVRVPLGTSLPLAPATAADAAPCSQP